MKPNHLNTEQEQKLKAQQADYAASLGRASVGYPNAYDSIVLDTLNAAKSEGLSGLRGRIQLHLQQARTESNKQVLLQELSDLLERHTEVARILDLLEEVRGY